MSKQMDIVERLDGYEDIADMDQAVQGDIREAKRELTRLRKIEEAARAAVEAGAVDEIHRTLIETALGEQR